MLNHIKPAYLAIALFALQAVYACSGQSRADRAREAEIDAKIQSVLSGGPVEETSTDVTPTDPQPVPSLKTAQQSATRAEAYGQHSLQVNPSFLAEWGSEDHFIDYMKVKSYPDDFRWLFVFQDGVMNTGQADAEGYINRLTGDMTSVPPGLLELQGPTMLFGATNFPEWYAGEWVLTWDGQADALVNGDGVRVVNMEQTDTGGRLTFAQPTQGAKPLRARFRNVRSPLTNLKLYRKRDEDKVLAGAIWNPDFIDYMKNYDVIRTMVMQDMNDLPVRSWDEIARPDDPFFVHLQPAQKPEKRPASGRYGVPYEYLFDLADQTDTALWLNVPIMLGGPVHPGDIGGDPQKMFELARANTPDILASPEWKHFAKEFTKRLVDSNYPADKPLYIELGNEIWNYAWPFAINTRYADGIGAGINSDQSHRYGYGYLTAKLISVMDAALLGTGYQPIYVIASQTASPDTSRAALQGVSDGLAAFDRARTDAPLRNIVLALTTYHGGKEGYQALLTPQTGDSLVTAWEREIARDGDALERRIHAHYLEGGVEALYGKEWVLQRWRSHRDIGAQFGVPILGAYEGGSHDNPPAELMASTAFADWWENYHWGPYGADVVRQINLAILEEFPGIMLSDFATIGEIGTGKSPWRDGHYAKPTHMMKMWREFSARKGSSQTETEDRKN